MNQNPLTPGRYRVSCPGAGDDKMVARHVVEDRSLLPKKVMVLPGNLPAEKVCRTTKMQYMAV
jgi:hypothetical protein